MRIQKCDALSNGAISTANASQNVVFLWTINYVYLNVFCLCQTQLIHSVLLLIYPPSLSLRLSFMYVLCVHTCVLTAVWTVLQAKVQRLILRVRI